MPYRFNIRLQLHAFATIAVLLSVVAMAAMACSESSGEEAAPTAEVTDLPNATDEFRDIGEEAPPELTVTAGDSSIVAGLGTFCWSYADVGTSSRHICADSVGHVTQVEALSSAGEPTLLGALESGTIEELSISASPTATLESQDICLGGATPESTCPDERARLVWGGAGGEGELLNATSDRSEFEADISALAPGSYVVSFFVRFAEGGDASYGVSLSVP